MRGPAARIGPRFARERAKVWDEVRAPTRLDPALRPLHTMLSPTERVSGRAARRPLPRDPAGLGVQKEDVRERMREGERTKGRLAHAAPVSQEHRTGARRRPSTSGRWRRRPRPRARRTRPRSGVSHDGSAAARREAVSSFSAPRARPGRLPRPTERGQQRGNERPRTSSRATRPPFPSPDPLPPSRNRPPGSHRGPPAVRPPGLYSALIDAFQDFAFSRFCWPPARPGRRMTPWDGRRLHFWPFAAAAVTCGRHLPAFSAFGGDRGGKGRAAGSMPRRTRRQRRRRRRWNEDDAARRGRAAAGCRLLPPFRPGRPHMQTPLEGEALSASPCLPLVRPSLPSSARPPSAREARSTVRICARVMTR